MSNINVLQQEVNCWRTELNYVGVQWNIHVVIQSATVQSRCISAEVKYLDFILHINTGRLF